MSSYGKYGKKYYEKLRADAVRAIANFWELDAPKCMSILECEKDLPLEINHIYGNCNPDRVDIHGFYRRIRSGEYDLWRVNLLCQHHNKGWQTEIELLQKLGLEYSSTLTWQQIITAFA